ncbi:MAG: hypothetical protein QOJ22_863 [Thermoleophilaceae bacterium]|nr:hypothetical protein [Thermoleophilaceae bacterium]
MTKKADFNAEEWATVVEGPLLAGMRVVGATRGGTIRESLAIGRVYQEARQAHGESELLDELVASPPSIDAQRLQGGGDIAAVSGERLREALGLVAEKATPEEVEAYKQFVVTVAQAAAEAHKEGGFAGIGGKPVSDEEQAALDDIRALLDAGTSDGGPAAG